MSSNIQHGGARESTLQRAREAMLRGTLHTIAGPTKLTIGAASKTLQELGEAVDAGALGLRFHVYDTGVHWNYGEADATSPPLPVDGPPRYGTVEQLLSLELISTAGDITIWVEQLGLEGLELTDATAAGRAAQLAVDLSEAKTAVSPAVEGDTIVTAVQAVETQARNSVALAATPPVATGGDAATIAGLIEVQAARAAQPAFDVLDSAMAAALGGTTPAMSMPMFVKADHDHAPMEVDANTLALYRLHESWADLSGNDYDLKLDHDLTITPWGAEFFTADRSYALSSSVFDFSGASGVTIDFAGRHIGSVLGIERPFS
ncbi:MAG: hypothetical protein WC992_02230, partial [Acholeplasmataceae bacterium]